jgi:hypothetical protein
MLRGEAGRIVKDNVTLIEYEESIVGFSNNYFLQVGVVGLHFTEKELKNLYTVLNYYVNIEEFASCTIKVGDQDVAIS